MHHPSTLAFSICVIFIAAAGMSTLALYTRQSLLVAYMLVGVLLGPWGLKFIADPDIVSQTGEIGIIFLLFLLGLHLHPQNLWHMLRKMTWITLISSLVFALIGYAVGMLFHYSSTESLIIGLTMMFSSTIIGLKLLPTTVLHHQHTGELVISILLMQDIVAILVLLALQSLGPEQVSWLTSLAATAIVFPLLCGFALLIEKVILVKLIARFDRIKEYMFLVAIAWCLGLAELATRMHLSPEIGAFIAGVTLAASPISLYIAESLKPLRDFFLVMFFFSIGASFNLTFISSVFWAALLLMALVLVLKPVLYYYLLKEPSGSKQVAWEVGIRLGQSSEFSLLLAYLAVSTQLISDKASYLIQATTLLTFIASSYIVVLRYPTPIAISDKMRRD